jgi:hypothetical protein
MTLLLQQAPCVPQVAAACCHSPGMVAQVHGVYQAVLSHGPCAKQEINTRLHDDDVLLRVLHVQHVYSACAHLADAPPSSSTLLENFSTRWVCGQRAN